jgi:hypothetical protein
MMETLEQQMVEVRAEQVQNVDSARSVVTHHSDEIIQTHVEGKHYAPMFDLQYELAPDDVRVATDSAATYRQAKTSGNDQLVDGSPRAESVKSRHSDVIVQTDVTEIQSAPVAYQQPTTESGKSSRRSSVRSTTSQRSHQLISPRQVASPGNVKSPGIMSPRSGEVTPRRSKPGSTVNTPRDEIVTPTSRRSSVKSGQVTPNIKSPTPVLSPKASSIKSTSSSQTDRSNQITPIQSPVDEMFKTASGQPQRIVRTGSMSSGARTPESLDGMLKSLQDSQDILDGGRRSSSPFLVPHCTPVVESIRQQDFARHVPSTDMQESLPEDEANLLKEVHQSMEVSAAPDVTARPHVKSPSSSISDVFDQKEMQKVPLLIRIVASAICVAEKAGDVIRNILKQGDLGIVEKGKNDLQTEADRAAERCIVASLQQQFSDIKIIGEEDANSSGVKPDWVETSQSVEVLQYARELPDDLRTVQPQDVVIWVDPLDGTSEYTEGLLDHVTTLIGIYRYHIYCQISHIISCLPL